ncbi:GNAT family N-acetyltransferase [Pelagicoccus sp. SDUM812002]|uniref:GNAT family N-acetyltransferase n=1 Tax=Pelagicoccus sp. SDUM812002 TaxID=3041266 RepID=UPI0028106018|nr:GNAT family N-acetyltransferase [Pelagicoccus sp. SDUM812002]MDQ8188588.1 GNAT family N-acetyltransferase [Pelagicoccus sp. SDUM812002]
MFEESDLDAYAEIVNNLSNATPYWPPGLQPRANLKKEFAENSFWKPDYKLLLVTDKEGNMIGEVETFKSSPNIKGPEVGFRIFEKKNMGRGFMTEALRLFSAYLFQTESSYLRLTLLIHSGNTASLKVAEKCGYKKEGTLRNAYVDYSTGIPHSDEILSLLREESPSLIELLQKK